MRGSARRFVLRASACHQFADSGAPRHGPSVFDVQPDDLSAAGSCATALARRHRTDSLGRVEVTGRDDMPPGLHDPRAEARRTEAVPDPSAVGVVHEAAGQRAAASRTVARESAQGDSFEALAAAHSRALAKLSSDIATAIRAEAEQKP